MMNSVVNLCWWNTAAGHCWEVAALPQIPDERTQMTPPDNWSDRTPGHLSVISAPNYNEQSCCLILTNFRTNDQQGKAKGPLCFLGHHWHVHVLLYYSLVSCSTQTAIQLPCRLLWLNVLPSTSVNERFFWWKGLQSCVFSLDWFQLFKELILTIWSLRDGGKSIWKKHKALASFLSG